MTTAALLLLLALLIAPMRCVGATSEAPLDMLQYMLQTEDKGGEWLIGGVDTHWMAYPERSAVRAFSLSKFSSADFFEVFEVTGTDIRIRYEVSREGGRQGKGNWIRRFEEIDSGISGGAVWVKRHMTPGGEGFVSRYRQDRFAYDESKQAYVHDPRGSGPDFRSYISVVWADAAWARAGLGIDKVLRMVSEWQTEGLMIETYDYAKGKGLVNWRWLERLDSLRPVAGDKTGRLFYCENGCVEVVSPGTSSKEPVVHKYDPSSGARGGLVDVVKMTSHWRKAEGPKWYVVYRDLSKEHPILKQSGCVRPTIALPEYTERPTATIADLPYVNTHRPAKQ